jgi:hypothetical protein
MKILFRIVLALALVVTATAAFAGETGSVSGTVKDGTGAPVPGATVKISGPQLPAGRNAVTSSTGAYNFQRLLPGTYKVEAELQGLGKVARQVAVTVDADTQVSLTLIQAAAAQVTVSAQAVSVDLKSSEVSINVSDKEIKALPLARSYSGLISLIPGASTDPNYSGFNAGGTVQDNLYLIDGVNISNPGFGYLSIETNELDIADFNVKRGGITAETRSVGAIVNAVTKTGTNELNGSVRIEASPTSFGAKSIDPAVTSKTERYVPAFGLGFPILKDTLFGYASGRFLMNNTTDRVNPYGPLPDGEVREQEYHGKLTFFPNQKNFISVDGRVIPQKNKNVYDNPSGDESTVGYAYDNTQWTASVAWNLLLSASTFFEAKYIHLTEENQGSPQNNIGLTPAWNATNICANGQYPHAGGVGYCGVYQYSNTQNYKRDEFKINGNQFFDLGPTQHQVKGGFGYESSEEDLTRLANGWGLIANSTAVTVNGVKSKYRGRWYPDQSTQLSPAQTYSLYLQDTVTIGQHLTVTAGFMMNHDIYGQTIAGVRNNFLSFGMGNEFQPRLGIVWNPELLKGDKVYGNYGKYMDLNQKSSARSLAPARIYQMESFFDATGNLLLTRPRASTTGKTIDSGLKPTYLEEIVLGYSAPVADKWSVDLWGQYRATRHFIEDVPGTYPDNSPYHVSNLDEFGASRRYRALTLEVQRRLANHWAFDASYTLSRFEGNFDLDYGGGGIFNTSSYIQDGPGWYVYDPNRFGLLSTDRTHIAKFFGSYEFMGVTLGGYLRIQSGRPWEARGQDPECNCYSRYLEPAGTRRMPTWTNFDLLVSYTIPVNPLSIRVEARVQNLFNTQTALSVNRAEYLDGFVYSTVPPYYAAPQGTTLPNQAGTAGATYPYFGDPTSYAPPRRLIHTAVVDFGPSDPPASNRGPAAHAAGPLHFRRFGRASRSAFACG